MGLYNFQPRFVPFIRDGRKTHTIRATRALQDKPGNILHLYTGLRTKKAKLLMRVECVRVEEITIYQYSDPNVYGVSINGCALDRAEREALALRDGFVSFDAMIRFWTSPTNRLPFRGQIIHWKKPTKESK